MAEQLLHGPQIAARLQHVRGEGVAQHVRMHVGGDAGREREIARICRKLMSRSAARSDWRRDLRLPVSTSIPSPNAVIARL